QLLTIVVKRVSYTKLEAREVGGIVADGVIHAVGIDGTECIATVSQPEATTEGVNHAQHVVSTNVVLATKTQAAPIITSQTYPSLTTKQSPTLHRAPVSHIKPTFKHKLGTQTITQVLGTFQAPAASSLTGVVAIINAGTRSFGARKITVGIDTINDTFVTLVGNTGIDNTVERHRGFGLSDAGEADCQCSSKKSLFHIKNSPIVF